MRTLGSLLGAAAGLLALACSDSGSSPAPPLGEVGSIVLGLQLTRVAQGLDRPTFVTALPGTDSLLVLEQGGRVRWLENGQLRAEPFLDLSSRVLSSGGEQGLLGLAFHPRFSENGRFYLHYSSVIGSGIRSGDGVVSEFTRRGAAATVDPASERRVLSVAQPYSNHNGGMLAFSPSNGYLYIGLGDGGSGGDPQGNGQNTGVWLGKMLRIDVDARDQGEYGIPEGNLIGNGVRPEIWSIGLRNPWRYSFDPDNGDLYIGDVGQNAVEEVDYEPSGSGGRNYGWNTMEGSRCYEPNSGCDQAGKPLLGEREDHPADPGPVDRPGAHRARLGARVQRVGGELLGVEAGDCLSNEVQLGVCGAVALGDDRVLGFEDDGAVTVDEQ